MIMTGFEYYTAALFNKYAQFKGRASRSEFWYFGLFSTIVSYGLQFLDSVAGFTFGDGNLGALSMLYSFAVLIPALAVSARRLHDVNKSGWMYLLIFLPIIGWIWLFVLWVKDSNYGDNQYGQNPKGIGDYFSEQEEYQDDSAHVNQVLSQPTSIINKPKEVDLDLAEIKRNLEKLQTEKDEIRILKEKILELENNDKKPVEHILQADNNTTDPPFIVEDETNKMHPDVDKFIADSSNQEYYLRLFDKSGFFWDQYKCEDKEPVHSFYKMRINDSDPKESFFLPLEDDKIMTISLSNTKEYLDTACSYGSEVRRGKSYKVVKEGVLIKELDKWIIKKKCLIIIE